MRSQVPTPAATARSEDADSTGAAWVIHPVASAVRLAVQATPNPNFLRVEAQVLDGQARILSLSTVVGRF